MFFLASKILWFFLAPTNALLVLAFLGALFVARSRGARTLVISATGVLLIAGVLPVGVWLIRPLEERFPIVVDPPVPAGIVVLGGAIDDAIGRTRGQVSFSSGAERLTEGAALARRFPNARLIYSGGSNAILSSASTEGADARKLWIALGLDSGRIELEDLSRNTYENAVFTYQKVQPKPGDVWLLVTSAYHMPRAMGLFRKAGFNVVAYPVNFHSTGTNADLELNHEISSALALFDLATHEWTGLLAYWASGKIDTPFPGP
jgi:uncharacterized SAM-binding protein YcdF (DUF218 family)